MEQQEKGSYNATLIWKRDIKGSKSPWRIPVPNPMRKKCKFYHLWPEIPAS
jgi:hypothetical protein